MRSIKMKAGEDLKRGQLVCAVVETDADGHGEMVAVGLMDSLDASTRDGWLSNRARLAHLAVLRVREAQILAAIVGFLLTGETDLVLPPCPHVRLSGIPFGPDLAPRCLACDAIVDR